MKLFSISSSQGLPESQYRLANLLKLNLDDYDSCYELFKLAADQDHVAATFNIGILYEQGLIKESNVNNNNIENDANNDYNELEAIKCYRKAAEAGHSKSMVNLGVLLKKRKDVSGVGKQWLQKAATFGDSSAFFNLSVEARDCGDGKQAVHLLEKSVSLGNIKACYNLARAKVRGVDCEVDLEAAEQLMEKAAEGGDTRAEKGVREVMKLRRTEERAKSDVDQEVLERRRLANIEQERMFEELETVANLEEEERKRAKRERDEKVDVEDRARLLSMQIAHQKEVKSGRNSDTEQGEEEKRETAVIDDIENSMMEMERDMDELFVSDEVKKDQGGGGGRVGTSARDLANKYKNRPKAKEAGEEETKKGNDLERFKPRHFSDLPVDYGMDGEGGESSAERERNEQEKRDNTNTRMEESEEIARRRKKGSFSSNRVEKPPINVPKPVDPDSDCSADEGDEVPLPIPEPAKPTNLAIERAKAAKARRAAAIKAKADENNLVSP